MNAKIGDSVVRGVVCAVASVAMFSSFAKTCEWQLGGSGNWSDPANWQGGATPAAGDIVVINNSGNTPIEVNNDVKDLSLQAIYFEGGTYNPTSKEWEFPDTSAITLNGNALTLTGTGDVAGFLMTNTVYATVNVPLTVETGTIRYVTTLTLNGDVTIADGVSALAFSAPYHNWSTRHTSTGSQIWMYLNLNGTVIGPQTDLTFPSGGGQATIRIYKPVAVRDIVVANNPSIEFRASGNSYRSLVCGLNRFYLYSMNAVDPSVPFTWSGSGGHANIWAMYALYADQAIDCLEATQGTQPTDNGCYVYGGNNNQGLNNQFMTLTMRATKSASAWCKLGGVWDTNGGRNLNVVYAPQGNFTQTVVGRQHEMKGFLRVEGGSFVCGTGSTFSNLTSLTVFPSANFTVAGPDVPFKGGQTSLDISGTITVPAGMTLVVKDATAFGVPLTANTYTRAGGATWIAGDGAVQVLNSPAADVTYWKAAVDGDWNDATKWTAGVPTRGKKAYISADGADYAVTLTGEADATELTVRNAGAHTTTLLASGANATMTNVLLTIDRNGRLRVPAGATFTYSGLVVGDKTTGMADGSNYGVKYGLAIWSGAGSPVKILSTGEFLVDGGYANVTEYNAGNFQIGGDDPAVRGKLTVTAGVFRFYTPYLYQAFWVNHGGTVKVSGNAEFKADRVYKHSFMFCESEAIVEFSDNARLTGDTNWVFPSLAGHITFKDNAELPAWTLFSHGMTSDDAPVLTFTNTAHLIESGLSLAVGRLGKPTCNVFATLLDSATIEKTYNQGTFMEVIVGHGDDNNKGGSDATLNVGDAMLQAGNRGMVVGRSARASVGNSYPSTGTVNVRSGGTLINKAGWTGYGTLLGYGACTAAGVSGHPFVGRLNVEEGGTFKNQYGAFVLGFGYGEGEVNMKGGDLELKNSDAMGRMYIGLAGGIGRFNVSGGTVDPVLNWTASRAWIGGQPLADYAAATGDTLANLEALGFSAARHDAQGTLSVSGGTVGLPHVVVGADGSGTIEMVGSAGTLTVQSLVLSNAVADTTTKLAFKTDAEGVSPVKVTGTLTINPGSKLAVDMTGYTGRQKIKLFEAGSIVGSFASEDVTFTGTKSKCRFWVDGNAGYVKSIKGLVVVVY